MDVALDKRYRLEATNPPDSQVLRAGDRVVTTWTLIQAGDWLINYQVGKIERAFEADGRARLRSYVYDPVKRTLSLDTQVNDNVGEPTPDNPEVQQAGVGPGLLLGVLIGIVLSAATWLVYKRTQQVKHYVRKDEFYEGHLDVPQSVKDEAKEKFGDGPQGGLGLFDAVQGTAGAVGLVAIAVLAYIIFLGGKS